MTTSDLDEQLVLRPRIDLADVEPRSREQFARLMRQFIFKEAKHRLRGVR